MVITYKQLRIKLLVMTFSFLLAAPLFAKTILYPGSPVGEDVRVQNATQIIKLALSKIDEDWQFAYSEFPMERKRVEFELGIGEQIHIGLLPGTDAYDNTYLRVPFPIDKGLLGFRVAFINDYDVSNFESIATLDALKQKKACLSKSWTITQIFRLNNIPTYEADNYADNYINLTRGMCDYFSRGLSEALGEYIVQKEQFPSLVIEPTHLLRLPMAFYLYVSPNQPEIHQALTLGLERAKADGSFDALFQIQHNQSLTSLNVRERIIIPLEIENPHSPDNIPDDWWY